MATRDVGTQTPTSSSTIREETTENGSGIVKTTAKITAAGVGAATALGAAPAAVGTVGFTAGGIASGSTAAGMMSVLGGGATQAGGIVATCQAIGATGTAFVSGPAILAIGGVGVVLGGAGYLAYKGIRKAYKGIKKLKEEHERDLYRRRYKPSGILMPTYINQRHQYSQTD